MDSEIDLAVGDALQYEDEHGAVSSDWLRSRHPDCWEEALKAIQIDRAIRAKGDAIGDIGPYRLGRKLGEGGMGAVYEAELKQSERGEARRVAIKLIRPGLLNGKDAIHRLLREGATGRMVRHPNVVRTYDLDVTVRNGELLPYVVMELVEGQDLRSLLNEERRVSEGLCRAIGREVAKGLAAIHAAGVIHRDIKPENVLLSRPVATPGPEESEQPAASTARQDAQGSSSHGCVVKVMDLGVARLSDEMLRLSQTGAFVGSILYAAPECISGGVSNVDGRADLHALGLVLYELACGTNPYDADSVPEALEQVLHLEPPRLGYVISEVSPFFEAVVHTLLAKAPASRFQTAAELAQVLEEGERSSWWIARATGLPAGSQMVHRRASVLRETGLYGRDADLARLRELGDRVVGGRGTVVLVEGEEGIGKSRLVDDFVESLYRDRVDVDILCGRHVPAGTPVEGAAFVEAYRERLGIDAIRDALHETPGLVPAFSALLRGDAPSPGAAPLTRDSIQTVFVRATHWLTRRRPTVVVIEDLHLAGPDGLELFSALARVALSQRLLLIGTMRPPLDAAWLATLQRVGAQRVELKRLGASEVLSLARDALGSEYLAGDLGPLVAEKSEGNPLFALEILRRLKESGALARRDDDRWVATAPVTNVEIPATLADLIAARLHDLDDDDRSLLEVGVCVGQAFDPEVVAAVLSASPVAVIRRLSSIERRTGVVRGAGRDFVFDHRLIAETLYYGMHARLREHHHEAIGAALAERVCDPGGGVSRVRGGLSLELGYQFLCGRRGDRAVPHLRAALDYLLAAWRVNEAVDLTLLALSDRTFSTGSGRLRLLLFVAPHLASVGRIAEWHRVVHEAVDLAGSVCDPRLHARALVALAEYRRHEGASVAAEEALVRAISIARDDAELPTKCDALGVLAQVQFRMGRELEAHESLKRALEIARALGDAVSESALLNTRGATLLNSGEIEAAQACFAQARDLAHECGAVHAESIALGNLGVAYMDMGRLEDATAAIEARLRLAREIGDRKGEGHAHGNLAAILVDLGRHDEARLHVERRLDVACEAGDVQSEAIARNQLAATLLDLGRAEEAAAHLERSMQIGRACQNPEISLRALARLAGRSGYAVADVEVVIARDGPLLDLKAQMEVQLCMWRATGKRDYLADAQRSLDRFLVRLSEPERSRSVARVRLHREISAAARSVGLE